MDDQAIHGLQIQLKIIKKHVKNPIKVLEQMELKWIRNNKKENAWTPRVACKKYPWPLVAEQILWTLVVESLDFATLGPKKLETYDP